MVLKQANSAALGVPGKEFDLKASIVRLGANDLLRLVARYEATRLLPDAGSVYGLSRTALWRNAVGGAIAAETLATRIDGAPPAACYVGALLRDIGKLAIETALGHEAIERVPDSDGHTPFVANERQTLGLDHAELGAAMAEQWELPEAIVEAIRFHHEPPLPGEPRHSPINDVVHGADLICLWSGLGAGDDGAQYALAEHVRTSLALERHDAERLAAQTWERVRTLEHELGIDH